SCPQGRTSACPVPFWWDPSSSVSPQRSPVLIRIRYNPGQTRDRLVARQVRVNSLPNTRLLHHKIGHPATSRMPDLVEYQTEATAFSRIPSPSSSRCSGITSGGRNRSTLPYVPAVSTSRP